MGKRHQPVLGVPWRENQGWNPSGEPGAPGGAPAGGHHSAGGLLVSLGSQSQFGLGGTASSRVPPAGHPPT